jgi:hypothetical protein
MVAVFAAFHFVDARIRLQLLERSSPFLKQRSRLDLDKAYT